MTSTHPAPPAVPRWIAAALCILYGFAKLNGSQFTILDSELARPMGEVSGFWLTWHYFGYSHFYGSAIALVQIAAGILLIIPRTALVGALMLLPVAANIVLIDIFYGVDLGGTVAGIVLLVCVLFIVAPFTRRIRNAVLLEHAPQRPSARAGVALCLLVVGACGFTWWVANYNNRSPTVIDGVWTVGAQTGADSSTRRWRTVYFEHNRAYMVVFRRDDGTDAIHHFEVDSTGAVRVWETWLAKGALIMRGRLRDSAHVDLDVLHRNGGTGDGHLSLTRAAPPR